jgi:hypothetical protein
MLELELLDCRYFLYQSHNKVKSYPTALLSSMKATPNLDIMADLWSPREPKNIEEGPNESERKNILLFRGTPIEQDKLELSASFTHNKTLQTRHNLIPTSHLSLETINLQSPPISNQTP